MLRITFWLGVVLLYACSLSPVTENSPARLKLLPPVDGPSELLLKQKVTIRFGDQQSVFLVVSRFDKAKMRSVVLLATGQKLLTMEYNGDQLVVEGSGSGQIPGEENLAMMQFSLWPESSILQHYPASRGWRLETSEQYRELRNDSKPLIRVSYKGSQTEIRHFQRHYSVLVDTLEKTGL